MKTGYYEYLLKICMSIRPFAFHARLESDIHLVRSINNPCPQAKSSLRVAFPMMQAGPSSGACLQLELHCCWRSLGDLLTQASVKMKKTPNQTSETIQNHKQLVISSILEIFLWKHIHVQATRYLAHLEVRNSSQLLTGLPSSHHWWSWACLQTPKEGLSRYALTRLENFPEQEHRFTQNSPPKPILSLHLKSRPWKSLPRESTGEETPLDWTWLTHVSKKDPFQLWRNKLHSIKSTIENRQPNSYLTVTPLEMHKRK